MGYAIEHRELAPVIQGGEARIVRKRFAPTLALVLGYVILRYLLLLASASLDGQAPLANCQYQCQLALLIV